MPIDLYGNRNSTCSQRVLFTALESNTPLSYHKIDFATAQHKSPEFIKRQPFGKVPAAEIDGVNFFESRAISRIVAEQAGSSLIPKDLKSKAVFEQWASLESNTLSPLLDVLLIEKVFKPIFRGQPTDEAAATKAREDADKALSVFNEQLGQHEYIAGDFSLVDIFLTSGWQWLSTTDVGKEIFATYPNWAAWWKRVSSRPAWQQVMADAKAEREGTA